jgi:Papain-like cysteine protease AvrRpt2
MRAAMTGPGRRWKILAAPAFAALVIAASVLYMRPAGATIPLGVGAGLGAGVFARVAPPLDNAGHLYVLDGWGGVHPVGSAPSLADTASWPNKDIAFSLALFADGTGGYVLDGWGKLHSIGSAPAVDSGVYWPGWIGAREVVLAPWASRAAPAGYILDADGGIHPFGGAPAVSGNMTWPSKGTARGLVLLPQSTPQSVRGYTLDGFGGVYAFGGARPVVANKSFASDVARGLVVVPSHGLLVEGYTLDYSGQIHPFGGAPPVTPSATWPGRDMADSLVAWTAAPVDSPGGWVLDREGGVHAWGSAPALRPSVAWPGWDIARGLAGAGSSGGSTERLILEPQPAGDAWGAYFNQRDARWANVEVGGTFPVWKVGCLVSDLAMVYSHFGIRGATPAWIAEHGGWFDATGAIFNSALQIPGHPEVMVRDPSAAWIRAQVAAGHPVIVGMNLPSGGTHFVTLTGLNGGADYWVNDPWEQQAMHVTFSGDWFTRGPIYEAIAYS